MNVKQLQKAIDTPEVHDLVNAWLLQKAYTDITKEQVAKVYAEILREIPIMSDGKYGEAVERIYDHNLLYRCNDDQPLKAVWKEADKRLKAAKIKPADMELDYCPALVAIHELSKIEHQLADVTGKPLNLSAQKLLEHGLEEYKKWIELVVGAIVNSPNFKPAKL